MSTDSWDFFDLADKCEISYCSIVVLIVSIAFTLLLLIGICVLRRRIMRGKLHRIQIKKAPQKNSSEISIFPKKNDGKCINVTKKPQKPKTTKQKLSQIDVETNKKTNLPEKQLQPKPKTKPLCATDRTSNKPVNNFFEEKVLSENLQVEYFEDKDVGTDITTIPKERRGLDKNGSALDFLNFSNNGELSEKNFENFMKLKNKKRMFNNDDSIEFEDVDNFDINHSDKGSFKIENKLEIQNDDEMILNEMLNNEPKFVRNSESNENNFVNINGHMVRNFSTGGMNYVGDGVNPYIEPNVEQEGGDEEFEEKEIADVKADGLEIVREVNEESEKDRENKKW